MGAAKLSGSVGVLLLGRPRIGAWHGRFSFGWSPDGDGPFGWHAWAKAQKLGGVDRPGNTATVGMEPAN
jgi:hypothetical protein